MSTEKRVAWICLGSKLSTQDLASNLVDRGGFEEKLKKEAEKREHRLKNQRLAHALASIQSFLHTLLHPCCTRPVVSTSYLAFIRAAQTLSYTSETREHVCCSGHDKELVRYTTLEHPPLRMPFCVHVGTEDQIILIGTIPVRTSQPHSLLMQQEMPLTCKAVQMTLFLRTSSRKRRAHASDGGNGVEY
eukprot:1161696-Pelagomonas_calceolata.AAC.21